MWLEKKKAHQHCKKQRISSRNITEDLRYTTEDSRGEIYLRLSSAGCPERLGSFSSSSRNLQYRARNVLGASETENQSKPFQNTILIIHTDYYFIREMGTSISDPLRSRIGQEELEILLSKTISVFIATVTTRANPSLLSIAVFLYFI